MLQGIYTKDSHAGSIDIPTKLSSYSICDQNYQNIPVTHNYANTCAREYP